MIVTESMAFTTGAPQRSLTLPQRETILGSSRLATTRSAVPQEWLHEVHIQIKELLLLDDAWDGSVAAAIGRQPVETAAAFVTVAAEELPQLRRPYVSPTINGGVNLEWHSADAHFDVTFESDRWVYASAPGFEWEGSLREITPDAVSVLFSHFAER